jgi:hypothetical protein
MKRLLAALLLVLPFSLPIADVQADAGWEWDPSWGYHQQEWYDPSDWFDYNGTIDYEDTYYGDYYDEDIEGRGVYDRWDEYDEYDGPPGPPSFTDRYYTDDWYDQRPVFDAWYE